MNCTEEHAKSVIIDTKLPLLCNKSFHGEVVVNLKITAIELTHGPISLEIVADHPYIPGEWDTHPFMYVEKSSYNGSSVGEIVENTAAVRGILQELVNLEKLPLYTSTDISHRMRLIKALCLFWC